MAAALRSIRCYSPRLDFRPVAFFQLQGYALNESGVEGITREPRSLMDAKFVHEALTMLPIPGKDAGMVVEVYQPGYVMDDQVLRPSKVVVSSEPPQA